MKVSSKYKNLWKIASKDINRFVIVHLHVVRTSEEKGYVEATDGRRLCRVPCEFDKGEAFPKIEKKGETVGIGVLLTIESWKQAFKDTGKRFDGAVMFFTEKTVKTLTNIEMPLGDAGTYPNTSAVIPSTAGIQTLKVFGFNPQYVAELNDIVHATPEATLVMSDACNPYMVAGTEPDELAMVMPCRCSQVYLYGHKRPVEVDHNAMDVQVVPNPDYVPPAPAPVAPAPEAKADAQIPEAPCGDGSVAVQP